MGKLVATAAVALAYPLFANADFDFIDVEYEGVVDRITDRVGNAPPDDPEFIGYRLGDSISGRLRINTDLGPTDVLPLSRGLSSYRTAPGSGGFISGMGPPLFDPTLHDEVSVNDTDHPANGFWTDNYFVIDYWSTPNGYGRLSLGILSPHPGVDTDVSPRPGLDLVTGEGIFQTIDARPTSEVYLSGFLEKVANGVDGSIDVLMRLAMSRIRVTPGRCSP